MIKRGKVTVLYLLGIEGLKVDGFGEKIVLLVLE